MEPFRVYWTNHRWFSEALFATLDEAITYGKSVCFEFAVYDSVDAIQATWGPLCGTTYYGPN
jgi:hypothetical protein